MPTTLAALRRRRGLTQQALADASGVSVRAIRSLEGARPARPRRVTVERVLLVLKPDAAERAQLLAALGVGVEAHAVAFDALFASRGEHAHRLAAAAARYATVYARRRCAIAGRTVRSERHESVVVATEAGLDAITALVARPDVEVVGADGCRVRDARLRAGPLTALELEFPRPLVVGEGRRAAVDLVCAGGGAVATVGVRKGERVVVVEVDFEPQDPPRRCRRVFEPGPGGAREPGPDVAVDPAGTAVLVLVDPAAGWHGLAWEW